MLYDEEHLTRIADLKVSLLLIKTKINNLAELEADLQTELQTLSGRYDANVKASTDSDADYAAEVVDARVDSWANEHSSLGANIREGFKRLADSIDESQGTFQEQLNSLSETRLGNLIDEIDAHGCRKREILQEAVERQESDSSLQGQIQSLSEASLQTIVMISEIKESLREIKKEM